MSPVRLATINAWPPKEGMAVRSWVGVLKSMTPPWPPTYHWKLPLPGAWAVRWAVPSVKASATAAIDRMSVRITAYLRKVSAPGGSWRLPCPSRHGYVKMRDLAGNRGKGGGAVTRLTACCVAAYISRRQAVPTRRRGWNCKVGANGGYGQACPA